MTKLAHNCSLSPTIFLCYRNLMEKKSHYRVIILGSGAAGLTAAIYAARANLEPLLIEGSQPGGQLTITTDVENYPGFPKGILGPDLMEEFKQQAVRFGTETMFGEVTSVDLKKRPFLVVVARETYTCDGFFFKDKKLVVVGGGDTAMEEATFLTKFASDVSVVHRRDTLRASKIMQDRAVKNPKISFVWDTIVDKVYGDPKTGGVTGVRLKNVKTGKTEDFKTDGLFIAIGHEPNTKLFVGQLDMNPAGYILTHDGTKTKIP